MGDMDHREMEGVRIDVGDDGPLARVELDHAVDGKDPDALDEQRGQVRIQHPVMCVAVETLQRLVRLEGRRSAETGEQFVVAVRDHQNSAGGFRPGRVGLAGKALSVSRGMVLGDDPPHVERKVPFLLQIHRAPPGMTFVQGLVLRAQRTRGVAEPIRQVAREQQQADVMEKRPHRQVVELEQVEFRRLSQQERQGTAYERMVAHRPVAAAALTHGHEYGRVRQRIGHDRDLFGGLDHILAKDNPL